MKSFKNCTNKSPVLLLIHCTELPQELWKLKTQIFMPIQNLLLLVLLVVQVAVLLDKEEEYVLFLLH